MYEVEFKVELTAEDRAKLVASLVEAGFEEIGTSALRDTYVEMAESPHGGNDIKRYRDLGDRIVYTEKVWEDIGGQVARRETEREASREEQDAAIAASAEPVRIAKSRTSYAGHHDGSDVHIDLDTVKFDHSPSERYFVEAEVIAATADDVTTAKELVQDFLRTILDRTELVESPGMLAMATKHL